jgi:hypothetical protein
MPDPRGWSFVQLLLAFGVALALAGLFLVSRIYVARRRFDSADRRSQPLDVVSKTLAAGASAWCITMVWWIRGNTSEIPFGTLMLPALLTAIGTWAAWRHRTAPLFVTAAVLSAFSILTAFSFGRVYLPAAAALLWSALVSLEHQGHAASRA